MRMSIPIEDIYRSSEEDGELEDEEDDVEEENQDEEASTLEA